MLNYKIHSKTKMENREDLKRDETTLKKNKEADFYLNNYQIITQTGVIGKEKQINQ